MTREVGILRLTDGLPYRCDQCMYLWDGDFCERWCAEVLPHWGCRVFVRDVPGPSKDDYIDAVEREVGVG